MSENNSSTNTTPQSSIDIIYKLDENGLFTYVNSVMLDFLETNRDDLLGTLYVPFIREDQQQKVVEFYLNQVENRINSTYLEVPIINTSGKEAWVGQTCQLLYDGNKISEILVVARDITEKIRAKDQVRINEEKYKNIIDNINLGLMEVDLDEKIIYANNSFSKMTGYDIDELIGKNAKEIFLTDDDTISDKRVEDVRKLRKTGESSAYELKIKRKDGKSLWMIISGSPVRDNEGRIIGSLGIHNDITERKIQEIALKELLTEQAKTNEELRQSEGHLKAINQLAAKLINKTSVKEIVDEITSNTVKKFGFTDCVIYLLNNNKNLLAQVAAYGAKDDNGIVVNQIFVELGKGIVGHVALHGQPEIISNTAEDPRYIRDVGSGLSELAVPIIANGELIGVIDSEHPQPNFYTQKHLDTLVTIANLAANRIKNAQIAEQKELAEQALKENEMTLRSVIDSAMDGVIIMDEFGIVNEWNSQAEELFGFKHDEAVGQRLSELIIPVDYREAHEKGMAHFLKTGEGPVLNKRIEIVGLHKDQTVFPIELSIVPIFSDNQYSFSAFIRDITLRKKVEEDMKTALEKEKELREMKSRFVSMTSHEFRTPLTTIKSNVELLSFKLNKSGKEESAGVQKNFKRINSEIERLNVLMNDILMIGRLESGKIPFKPEPSDIYLLCESIVQQLLLNVEVGRTVKIEVKGEKRLITIDPNVYEHIITNLITNAFKYSPPEKDPLLKLDYGDDGLTLIVKDDGIGISKKDQDRLFESFFRADNVGNIQGTGLGLTIVKQFVEMHKGSIKVESELHKGTSFIVKQPYQMND